MPPLPSISLFLAPNDPPIFLPASIPTRSDPHYQINMIATGRAYVRSIVDNFGFHFAIALVSIYGGLGGIV